ncbi:PilN domain-containing protein [Candidatus Saccharibacteria bacterium]|nr:PilN domain-containing protein [Candidatus Saccharibacteria bacterium]
MINLLPPQQLANIRIARSNTLLRRYIELLLLALLIIITALTVAYYFMNVQQSNVQQVVDTDQAKISELEPVQKQAEQLSATVNTIAGLLSRDVVFSDMLVQIGGLMPQGAVLTGLQFSIEDFKSPLIISAQVDTEEKAAVLLKNLQGSDLFQSAEIKTIDQTEKEDTSTSTSTLTPTTSATAPVVADSPYKYTTVINAYFKQNSPGIKAAQ